MVSRVFEQILGLSGTRNAVGESRSSHSVVVTDSAGAQLSGGCRSVAPFASQSVQGKKK